MFPTANLHYHQLTIHKDLFFCVSNCSQPHKGVFCQHVGKGGMVWKMEDVACVSEVTVQMGVPQAWMGFPLCSSSVCLRPPSLGMSCLGYNCFYLKNPSFFLVLWRIPDRQALTGNWLVSWGENDLAQAAGRTGAWWHCLVLTAGAWVRAPRSVPATESPVTLGKSLSLCVARSLHK